MLTSLLALGALALTCYGFGRAVYALAYPGRAPLHAYATGLGLVALTFIGGALNAAGLATGRSLQVCAYGGIALAMVFIALSARRAAWRPALAHVWTWLLCLIVAGLALALASALTPTLAFNYHDDFFTYLVRPLRMQATGSLAGNPFEFVGPVDFGAQSFLQAILLVWLPLSSIAAFDTIFCLLLGLVLVAEFGRLNNASTLLIALAIVVYVFLDPQIVNVAAVYSIATAVLTLLIAVTLLLELEDGAPFGRVMLAAAPVGATLTALVALKMTALFFVAPFVLVLFAAVLIGGFRHGVRLAVATAAGSAVAVAPWLIAHADKFALLWSGRAAGAALDPALTIYPSIREAFSTEPSLYGAGRIEFAVAVLVLLLSLVAGAVRLVQAPTDKPAIVRIAAAVGGVTAYIGLAYLGFSEAGLRYVAAFLIALVPAALLFPLPPKRSDGPLLARSFSTAALACIVVAELAVILLFAGYAYNRAARLMTLHTAVAFPVEQPYLDQQAAALSERTRERIRSVQARTPAGSRIFAWIDSPFNLDFARNDVLSFHHDWFVAPWRLDASTGERLRRGLESRGVQYIVWQYRSAQIPPLQFFRTELQSPLVWGHRTIYQSTVDLLLALQGLASPFDVVYNDGAIVIISLRRPFS